MKKTLYLFALLGLLFGACDKIDEPYLEPTGSTGGGPGPSEKIRKVLLEEFTGHICVNCPEASLLAQDYLAVYGDQLILMAIHAGDLAVPGEEPFDADYRTVPGTEIYNQYQPIGVPTGMVNRTAYEGGGTVLFKDQWEPAIQSFIDIPPDAYIEMELTYDDASRKLDITADCEFLNDLSQNTNLSLFIVESGIVSAQKNDDENTGPVPIWYDYEHKHLLRAAVTGTWGEALASNPSAAQMITKDYSTTLSSDWDVSQLTVIAVIIDADTHEVIQAEEAHIE